MARQGKSYRDNKHTKPVKLLTLPGATLVFVGRPFFYLLFFSVYGIVLVFALVTGSLKRVALSSFANYKKILVKFASAVKSKPGKDKKVKLSFIHRWASQDIQKTGREEKSVSRDVAHRILPPISPPKFRPISFFKYLFIVLVTFSFVPVILGYSIIFSDLPSVKDLTTRNSQVSTKIYDRNGVLLYTIFKDKNRTPVGLDSIPEHAIFATLAIEDAEFYEHSGFSVRGITRAMIKNYEEKTLYGGSTITQQLVKNTLLSSEKTVLRKLRELALSIQVERYFNKDQILEMYLNEVSYGGTAYGIQEASQSYFEKDVSELNLAESSLLAGLPKSPTKYSPFGPNPEYAKGRQAEVLKLMEINGFINRQQREEALNTKIVFAENKIDIKAPHFVMYVRDNLEETYGKEVVEKGGLTVNTTLDYQIQTLAEKVILKEIESLKSLNVTNAAAVVLDSLTGEILAMVGSRDYFDTPNDGNVNAATSLRQPGSSIKVVNYAYALANGMTPASIIADTPESFIVTGQGEYTPQNYDGAFRGNLTLRSALAESRNVPAVKVLNKYGVDNMIDLGKNMGITTWEDRSRFGLSLTLGGGEVKLIDLARVYATLANYGKSPQLKTVKSIVNYKGTEFENDNCVINDSPTIMADRGVVLADDRRTAFLDKDKSDCEPKQVLDKRVAFMITDILKDNRARSPAFGNHSALVIPNHPEVAVKTGTSNNLRDNLTVGYNQDYVVAVWVGNNDNSPMSRVASGVTGASPIFNKIMSALLENRKSKEWEIPEGLVQLPICTRTGTLACSGCPVVNDWFLEENKPTIVCNPEWFNEDDEKESRVDGRILPQAASTSD